MVCRNVLELRFEKLHEYQKQLKALQKYSEKEFVETPLIYSSAERFLQLSIEVLLDVCEHLIRDLDLRPAEDAADCFSVLSEAKILPEKFAQDLMAMARFRNLLVHDYLKLDRRKIYRYLHENLDAFSQFMRYLKKFL